MKRVLVITLAMVLCLGAVAGATGGTKGGKDIKLTPIEGNAGLVTLNISDVVYIGFEQAQGEGQGFTQDEIDSGEAVFENIHKLKISSTVNYLVAANLLNDTEPIGFSDVVLQSMVPGSGSNIQWGVESANPDANRYVSDNLVYARARVASAAYDDGRLTCEEDWWQINGNCGDSYPDQYDFPPGPARENSYRTLCKGGPTSGVSTGDQVWIDIKLDLETAAEAGVPLPSGRYTLRIDYLVLEIDDEVAS